MIFTSDSQKKPSLVSLFTGAGGLDIGLEQAGFQTLVALEIEHYACETLRANQLLSSFSKEEFETWFSQQIRQKCYSRCRESEIKQLKKRLLVGGSSPQKFLERVTVLEKDIRTVSKGEILSLSGVNRGEISLVAGGSPCQAFSRAGKREAVNSESGKLFLEFVRIVDEIRPRWFLFENVKGIVNTKADVAYIYCKACGYESVMPFHLRELVDSENSCACSCWQCSSTKTEVIWRKKSGGSLEIIVHEFESLGYKCYWQVLNAADFGAPQARERLFIVGSRDGEPFKFPLPSHQKPIKITNEYLQGSLFESSYDRRKEWVTVLEALWSSGHWRYGSLDTEEAVLWVKNVVRPHDEPVTWSLKRTAPTVGAHQGAKLALAPFGVPEEQLRRQQWHVLGCRQRDLPPVFVEHEYLTDEELLALQTFPRSWYLFGTRMERAFQIGNAVPPVLAAAIGRALQEAMLNLNPSVSEKRIVNEQQYSSMLF